VSEGLFEAFHPDREISEAAARAMAAGIPVKVRKGVSYVYVNDATAEYLESPHHSYLAPLLCSCPQRPYAHEISVHRKARFEKPGCYEVYDEVYDGRDEATVRFAPGEMRWPWSLGRIGEET
jgi:hypothetical protein